MNMRTPAGKGLHGKSALRGMVHGRRIVAERGSRFFTK